MSARATHASTDRKVVVAQSPILTIEACACGVMHLHFGAVSMRFTEEGLESVRRTIAEALLHRGADAVPLFSRGAVRGEA